MASQKQTDGWSYGKKPTLTIPMMANKQAMGQQNHGKTMVNKPIMAKLKIGKSSKYLSSAEK